MRERRAAVLAASRAQLSSGAFVAAAAALEDSLTSDPAWGHGWLQHGLALARSGDDDGAALSFARACAGGCDDTSAALREAASENRQLCLSRCLPAHTLAWLQDVVRASCCNNELVRGGMPPAGKLLVSGATSAALVDAALFAAHTGWSRVTVVCGSRVVATTLSAAALSTDLQNRGDVRLDVLARLPADACDFSALLYDWGNTLDTAAVAAHAAARAACYPNARVCPSVVRVRAMLVESTSLAALSSPPGGAVRAGAHAFVCGDYLAATALDTLPVQLQGADCAPWRALTPPCTLLELDCCAVQAAEEGGTAAPLAGGWVDTIALADGDAHALVTWLEFGEGAAALGTGWAPPPDDDGLGDLGFTHRTQHAHFAPRGAPWRLRAGEALRCRASVTPTGVAAEVAGRPSCPPSAVPLPSYHSPMLCDAARNDAYAEGIAAAVASFSAERGRPPRALDVGAGSGLLSFLLARSGAASVLACERDPALAGLAGEALTDAGCGESACAGRDD